MTALRADPSGEHNAGDRSSGAKMQEDASAPNKTPSIIDQLSRTKTKDEIANQKKAKAQAQAQATDKVKDSDEPVPTIEVSRGRDPTESETTASTKSKHPDDERPSMALAPKSTRVQERDISPGTLPDGSHVKCSGEKGESYTPPTGLGKLAGKIRSAAH